MFWQDYKKGRSEHRNEIPKINKKIDNLCFLKKVENRKKNQAKEAAPVEPGSVNTFQNSYCLRKKIPMCKEKEKKCLYRHQLKAYGGLPYVSTKKILFEGATGKFHTSLETSRNLRWVGRVKGLSAPDCNEEVYLPEKASVVMPDFTTSKENLFGLGVKGSWLTSRTNVQKYGEEGNGFVTDVELENVLVKYGETLCLEQLRKHDMVVPKKHNGKAYPGLYTHAVIGKDKDEAYVESRFLANKMKRKMEAGIVENNHIYVTGSSFKKKVCDPLVDEDIKCRTMWMGEQWLGILERDYVVPLTRMITRTSKIFMIGKSNWKGGIERNYGDINDGYTCIAGDWKNFDATVPENVMAMAFSIVRGCLPGGRGVGNVLMNLAHNVMWKNLLVKGGDIYKVMKGVPSGTAFTSIITSIANWLLHMCILERKIKMTHVIRDLLEMRIMGDDWILAVPQFIFEEFMMEFLDYEEDLNETGLQIKPGSVTMDSLFCDEQEKKGIEFLGTKFKEGYKPVRTEERFLLSFLLRQKMYEPGYWAIKYCYETYPLYVYSKYRKVIDDYVALNRTIMKDNDVYTEDDFKDRARMARDNSVMEYFMTPSQIMKYGKNKKVPRGHLLWQGRLDMINLFMDPGKYVRPLSQRDILQHKGQKWYYNHIARPKIIRSENEERPRKRKKLYKPWD